MEVKKNYTISDLLTILPLEEALKKEFLMKWETAEESLKIEYEEIIWASFLDYKKRLTELKFQQLLLEVQEGKRGLTTDLMQTAKQQVYQEFADILSGKKQDQQQVEEIREKLQNLSTN